MSMKYIDKIVLNVVFRDDNSTDNNYKQYNDSTFFLYCGDCWYVIAIFFK